MASPTTNQRFDMKARERACGLTRRIGLRNISRMVGNRAILMANRMSVNRLNALENFMVMV